jgi:tetratricopeptide (TPR) repeat protein
LAEKGKIQEAIAAYTEAQTLNPNLRDIDPIAEAHRVAASELFQKGSQLATEGKIQEAVAAYEEAKALDPKRSDLDPAMEAHKWVAQGLLQKAKRSAQNGKIQDAIAAFEEAKTLDLTLKRSVQTWAMLCWYGSLEGYAAEVLHACEQAVVLAPENGRSRDLRGLARALTDNITGAIEDFQAFVEWTYDEEDKALVKGWIEALREGENPFTDEVLKELRGGITTGIGFTRDF